LRVGNEARQVEIDRIHANTRPAGNRLARCQADRARSLRSQGDAGYPLTGTDMGGSAEWAALAIELSRCQAQFERLRGYKIGYGEPKPDRLFKIKNGPVDVVQAVSRGRSVEVELADLRDVV